MPEPLTPTSRSAAQSILISADARRLDRLAWIVVAALSAIGFSVRAAGNGQSLMADELFAWFETAGRPLSGVLEQVRGGLELSPPLYFLVARGTQLVGDPSVTIRLPSLISGTLLIPAVYGLCREFAGRRAGLTAAALTATSSIGVFYSNEARPYAMLALASALSTLVLLRALRSDRGGYWLAYALATIAIGYLHYFGVFVVAVQFVWAAVTHRAQLKALIVSTGIAGLAVLAWVTYSGVKSDSTNMLPPFAMNWDVLEFPARLFIGYPFFFKFSEIPGVGTTIVFAGSIATAAVMTIIGSVRARQSAPRSDRGSQSIGSRRVTWVLAPALALAGPVGTLFVSLAGGSMVTVTKYSIASLPAALICAALILTNAGRRAGVVLSVIAVGASAWSCGQLLKPEYQRPDMRAAAHWIDSNSPANVVLINELNPANGVRPLAPYLRTPSMDPVSIFVQGISFRTKSTDYLVGEANARKSDLMIVFNDSPAMREAVINDPRWASKFSLVNETSGLGVASGYRVLHFKYAAVTD